MSPKVYLAGPIAGTTAEGANSWRTEVASRLRASGIDGISPLRCEPQNIGGTYTLSYDDPKFGHHKAIASKNMMDTKMSTLVLAYLPMDLNPNWPSVGTIIEIALAKAWGIPVVLVSNDARLLDHPLVRECAAWVLPTLSDACDLIEGLLEAYVE